MADRIATDLRGYRLDLDAEEGALLDLAGPGGARTVQGKPDWRAVASMARLHRLGARLHRALEDNPAAASPPEEIRDQWRADYYTGLHESVRLLDQRDRAARLLAEQGIRPMAVKGAALSGTLYPDPAVRPMGDIDFLIPPGTTQRVQELAPSLESQGVNLRLFEIEEDHHDLTMDGAYRIDYARLWSEATPAAFADGKALVPSVEDQLLMVCTSCCRNSFWNLVTVLDAAELLHQRGGEIDWPRTVQRAGTMQIDVALDTLLALVAMLFGETVPPQARAGLAPAEWRRRLVRRFLGGYRLRAAAGMEEVNIGRPIDAFALKYAVNRRRVLTHQVRAVLLPDWRWMRAHYPRAGRGEILLRYLAHPVVVLGLALRLALGRRRPDGDALSDPDA